MRKLSLPGKVAICALAAVFQCWPWLQAQSPASHTGMIEITETDLFSATGWDSTLVDAAGLRLGMAREEAMLAVRRRGFQLMAYGPPTHPLLRQCSEDFYCFLAGGVAYVDQGLMVQFSQAGRIVEIDIEAVMEHRPALLALLSGETRRFFDPPYSDALRIKLLGPETVKEAVSGRYGDKFKDTNYVYKKKGIIVTVSPGPGGDPTLELTDVRFVPPER